MMPTYDPHVTMMTNNTVSINGPNSSGYYTIYPTTSGTGGTVYTTDNTWITPSNTLDVRGDATIQGTLTVGGTDIGQSLKRIEERLAILHGNEELESRWECLRELRKQYLELEAELLEREEIYKILSK